MNAKTTRADPDRGANSRANNSSKVRGSKARDNSRVKVKGRVGNKDSKERDKDPVNKREWAKASRVKDAKAVDDHLPVSAEKAREAECGVPEASPAISKTGAVSATSEGNDGLALSPLLIPKPAGRWSAPCATRPACCPA